MRPRLSHKSRGRAHLSMESFNTFWERPRRSENLPQPIVSRIQRAKTEAAAVLATYLLYGLAR